ncbi:hypothetical protein L7F22_004889 [Adiantum nelumboides]|nr:hypothetical protein [Adiantum nelumboides]
MVLKGKAAVGGVKPCWREEGSAGQKKAMVGGLYSLPEGDENKGYEEFSGWRNAGGVIELPREHSPTHCLHFRDAGVVIPLIWSLNSQWKTLGRPDAEHFVSYFPELTMALASHPWNPISLHFPTIKLLWKPCPDRFCIVWKTKQYRLKWSFGQCSWEV